MGISDISASFTMPSGGSIPCVPVFVDASFIASAGVSGDGNQPNNILTLTENRADAGWVIAGNTATYTGSPDHVVIDAMAWYQETQSGALQRVQPVLELLKNGTIVPAKSETGYQRHISGTTESSNTIAYTDPSPGANPFYQLRAQQGSSQDDVIQVDLGHFTARAIEKISVSLCESAVTPPQSFNCPNGSVASVVGSTLSINNCEIAQAVFEAIGTASPNPETTLLFTGGSTPAGGFALTIPSDGLNSASYGGGAGTSASPYTTANVNYSGAGGGVVNYTFDVVQLTT
ncbi:hypothetical protein N9137_01050 [Pseudomonadales bacterium]|nr:hypothetical protein [Pseudomonadales bacterium]